MCIPTPKNKHPTLKLTSFAILVLQCPHRTGRIWPGRQDSRCQRHGCASLHNCGHSFVHCRPHLFMGWASDLLSYRWMDLRPVQWQLAAFQSYCQWQLCHWSWRHSGCWCVLHLDCPGSHHDYICGGIAKGKSHRCVLGHLQPRWWNRVSGFFRPQLPFDKRHCFGFHLHCYPGGYDIWVDVGLLHLLTVSNSPCPAPQSRRDGEAHNSRNF